MEMYNKITYQHYTSHFIKSSITYMNSFYIQETPYMKMETKYCIMDSINQDKQ